jgi:hypothetical protein
MTRIKNIREIREIRGSFSGLGRGLNHLFLLQLVQLGGDDHLAVGRARMVVKILLVIILRLVKFCERHDLSDDQVLEVLLRFGLGFLGHQLLHFVAIKDDGAIGRAHVRALAVQRGRVVCLPENVQELCIGNLRRIEFNLRHFGMAGGFGANLFVGGIGRAAAGKTAGDGNDTGQPLEDGFHAPEAAATEVGDFNFVGFVRVHAVGNGTGERGEIQRGDGRQKTNYLFHVVSQPALNVAQTSHL